jgi:hypothetical protein
MSGEEREGGREEEEMLGLGEATFRMRTAEEIRGNSQPDTLTGQSG